MPDRPGAELLRHGRPSPRHRRPTRWWLVGLAAAVALLAAEVLVFALRSEEPEEEPPIDDAAVVEYARLMVVDLLTYSPTDTSRVESALDRLCDDSPDAGSADGLVAQLRNSEAGSEVKESSIGQIVGRTPAGDLVVSFRVITWVGTFGRPAEKTNHDLVTVRPEPAMCVYRLELAG
ncbi:hypothetical protein [Gordonia westfalica]|uniref:hypothetical protein n=1 Tax=Gordonia westfalica TaxID=158898 RepID=UPI001FCAAAD2|nr:hypothetical protein [Gordonia westfalica]